MIGTLDPIRTDRTLHSRILTKINHVLEHKVNLDAVQRLEAIDLFCSLNIVETS
jgi:hypothetical protein